MGLIPPITNLTPFTVGASTVMDHLGDFQATLILSARFHAPGHTPPSVADEQYPIRLADVYAGEPAHSSVLYEADTAWFKPAVDVLINGSAIAPERRAVESLVVGFRVAGLRKELRVSGDRFWYFGFPSSPRPFTEMPIIYERAFGGPSDRRNPVGIGSKGALNTEIETEVPNVEHLDKTSAPGGFGVVARNWLQRSSFAGTYDQGWLDHRWPLLPVDFDCRYHQATPADQQCHAIAGGEEVEVTHMTSDGIWSTVLPNIDAPVTILHNNSKANAKWVTDTVLLEPSSRTIVLTARLSLPVCRGSRPLREVIIGHATRGWLRARVTRKHYLMVAG